MSYSSELLSPFVFISLSSHLIALLLFINYSSDLLSLFLFISYLPQMFSPFVFINQSSNMVLLFLFISYSSHLLSLMLFSRLRVTCRFYSLLATTHRDIIPVFVIIICSYLRSFSSSSSSYHLLTHFLSYRLLISPTDTPPLLVDPHLTY